MANFSHLEELVVAANSRVLFNGMLVYFERENRDDLAFANGLHNLWVELLERTSERQLFIIELEHLYPSVMTYKVMEFLNKVQNHDVIKLLELSKMIAETHRHVLRKIDLIETIRETTIDLEFAADLHNLWVQLIDRTNDRKLFITELEGVPPIVQLL
nr:hypothetical protein [Tanacetum cinerariifolium]